jgi:hypothetical protein
MFLLTNDPATIYTWRRCGSIPQTFRTGIEQNQIQRHLHPVQIPVAHSVYPSQPRPSVPTQVTYRAKSRIDTRKVDALSTTVLALATGVAIKRPHGGAGPRAPFIGETEVSAAA